MISDPEDKRKEIQLETRKSQRLLEASSVSSAQSIIYTYFMCSTTLTSIDIGLSVSPAKKSSKYS